MGAVFNADTVDSMGWDFTKWMPEAEDGKPVPDLASWVGEVPEPSQELILAFYEAERNIGLAEQAESNRLTEARKAWVEQEWRKNHAGEEWPGIESVILTPEEQIAMYASDTEERETIRGRMHDQLVAAVAAVCQQSPSAEVLAVLPHRILTGFRGWLVGQLSPEAVAAAISR